MSTRKSYALAFVLLLALEVYIGMFVRDAFIRPYVGDMLVTLLLCCFFKALRPGCRPALPVLIFAAAVEAAQALQLTELLGLEGTLLGVLLGSTFDWHDIACYAVGCLVFAAAEGLRGR